MNRIEQRFRRAPVRAVGVDLDGEPIGFIGLSVPWFRRRRRGRLAHRSEYWGHGYAPEAASECLRYAFDNVDLDEVISFTAAINDQVAAGDGEDRPHARPGRRLRPSRCARGEPAAPARPVPHHT